MNVNNQDITASNVVKDLGLLVSDDLKWMTHINNKLLSSNKSLHFIKCNFPFTVSRSFKLRFVNMCIKNNIFYASPVWFPSLCYTRKLERFHRKCLKWVIGSRPYQDQFFLTKALPICYHLIFNNVLLFYKMLHGHTELPFSAFFFLKVTISRKSTIVSKIQTAKKLRSRNSSFIGLIRLGVDIFAPLESFKRRVKELLLERTVNF